MKRIKRIFIAVLFIIILCFNLISIKRTAKAEEALNAEEFLLFSTGGFFHEYSWSTVYDNYHVTFSGYAMKYITKYGSSWMDDFSVIWFPGTTIETSTKLNENVRINLTSVGQLAPEQKIINIVAPDGAAATISFDAVVFKFSWTPYDDKAVTGFLPVQKNAEGNSILYLCIYEDGEAELIGSGTSIEGFYDDEYSRAFWKDNNTAATTIIRKFSSYFAPNVSSYSFPILSSGFEHNGISYTCSVPMVNTEDIEVVKITDISYAENPTDIQAIYRVQFKTETLDSYYKSLYGIDDDEEWNKDDIRVSWLGNTYAINEDIVIPKEQLTQMYHIEDWNITVIDNHVLNNKYAAEPTVVLDFRIPEREAALTGFTTVGEDLFLCIYDDGVAFLAGNGTTASMLDSDITGISLITEYFWNNHDGCKSTDFNIFDYDLCRKYAPNFNVFCCSDDIFSKFTILGKEYRYTQDTVRLVNHISYGNDAAYADNLIRDNDFVKKVIIENDANFYFMGPIVSNCNSLSSITFSPRSNDSVSRMYSLGIVKKCNYEEGLSIDWNGVHVVQRNSICENPLTSNDLVMTAGVEMIDDCTLADGFVLPEYYHVYTEISNSKLLSGYIDCNISNHSQVDTRFVGLSKDLPDSYTVRVSGNGSLGYIPTGTTISDIRQSYWSNNPINIEFMRDCAPTDRKMYLSSGSSIYACYINSDGSINDFSRELMLDADPYTVYPDYCNKYIYANDVTVTYRDTAKELINICSSQVLPEGIGRDDVKDAIDLQKITAQVLRNDGSKTELMGTLSIVDVEEYDENYYKINLKYIDDVPNSFHRQRLCAKIPGTDKDLTYPELNASVLVAKRVVYNSSLKINYYVYDKYDAEKLPDVLFANVITAWNQETQIYTGKNPEDIVIEMKMADGDINKQIWTFCGWEYDSIIPDIFKASENQVISAYAKYRLVEEKTITGKKEDITSGINEGEPPVKTGDIARNGCIILVCIMIAAALIMLSVLIVSKKRMDKSEKTNI